MYPAGSFLHDPVLLIAQVEDDLTITILKDRSGRLRDT
jgi:hypothetical protein